MSYTVILSHDESAFRRLQAEWSSLAEMSAADGVYLTWEWVSTWWTNFHELGELWLLEARASDNRLVGIAPLMLALNQPMPGVVWRQLQFISSPHHFDHLDFLIETGHEAEVINAFLAELQKHQTRWDVLSLTQILPTSPTIAILEQSGIEWQEGVEDDPAPYIALPDSWETHFNSMSKHQRKKQRRYWRDLEEAFPNQWHADYVTDPAEIDMTFDALIALHQKKWEALEQDGAYGDPQMVTFHRQVMHLFIEKGWLRLWRLWVQGKPAALFHGFQYRGRFYDFSGGIDFDIPNQNLGHILTEIVLQDCIESGVREFDFLWGTEPYKYSWGAVDRIDHSFVWLASSKARFGQQVTEVTRSVWHSAKTILPTDMKNQIASRIKKIQSGK